MKRLLLGQIRIVPKLSLEPNRSWTIKKLKTKIEDANTFYKRLVGMEKVEQHRSNMINLKGRLKTMQDNLNYEKSRLNLTQLEIKQLEEEIARTDRVNSYERFAEMLKKEKELKHEEEQQITRVKTKEGEREGIYSELDSVKTTVLMLESDHTTYHRYLKYLFSLLAFFSTIFYVADNKKILNGIEEIKRMNRRAGGSTWDYVCGVVWWGTSEGFKKTVSGIQWFASKSGSAIATSAKWTGSTVYWGAQKTGSGIKWAACGSYNTVMKLWKDGKGK